MPTKVITVQNVSQSRCRSTGFTLIEVMIVVAIIGILAAVALPAYNDYVRRGQIPEAFTQLSAYRAKMEQYYQDNRNYGTAAKCAADSSADGWNSFVPGNAKYFGFGCVTNNSQQGYTITATGNAASAVGHVYTIDHNGDRTTTKFKGADVTATCWLTSSATC
ncbi:type IV pilin protein [Variovorax ginsengisoli]|uniref:Type IV pilin protein n=2 Tax=Variovorax ginsengisoli TaxID=363844 RepID=A0ABT8RX71_9BURK|nr:type IV pilin protein [Variovorax ginsengisoli]MDN8612082.1 type IV pilin protein [Variovorax ginsengisoli]MDO1531252.1 type IV pilin protein [Variovorax ginsengisoli]